MHFTCFNFRVKRARHLRCARQSIIQVTWPFIKDRTLVKKSLSQWHMSITRSSSSGECLSFYDCSLRWPSWLNRAWATRGDERRQHPHRHDAPPSPDGCLPHHCNVDYERLWGLRHHLDESSVGTDASLNELDDGNWLTWSCRWLGWRNSVRRVASQSSAINTKRSSLNPHS